MDDLINDFLAETNESLSDLDNELVALEKNPNDKDLLSSIFRVMHTIKGTCGFLGLPRLEKVAHSAENVLGRFRDGDLEVTPEYVTLIFDSLDCIKEIIAGIEQNGEEPQGDDSALIEKLDAVYEGREAGSSAEAGSSEEHKEENTPTEDLDALFAQTETENKDNENNEDNEEAIEQTAPEKEEEKPSEDVPQANTAEAPVKKEATSSTQSLRVNVDVLEDLMTMVSELVLTRNQLLQILRIQKESEFATPLQRLNHVVSELQEGVMKTRMQPIGNAWAKLPRIIRDISIELNKKIELNMRGQDTELDRQVLDMIKDPLTHMVRNSADHGIEKPEDRIAAGKPEKGTIDLNAYHEGGHIIIEITDDGKGLNTEKIKEKIIGNGLATEEELEALSTQQIHQYIFKAGFSTAEKVTSVSGRGVGMDVVRTNIEKIGGTVELRSVEGKGSTFQIKIPLTLAIVSALIVEAGLERFAIPQLAVRELVMTSKTGDQQIEMIKGTPFFRLRDQLLPLVRLDEILSLRNYEPSAEPEITDEHQQDENQEGEAEDNILNDEEKETGKNQYIVVAQVGSYHFGLIVDRVFDTEEIVVKPVSKILKNIDIFSGNTILGDGAVIMILDPSGIAKATGELEVADASQDKAQKKEALESTHEKTSLLLFKAGDGAPKAVPLSLVSRLEEINIEDLESSDGEHVIQYRGKLMPVVPMYASMNIQDARQKPILVFSNDDKNMGLIVDEIIDIAEEHIDVQIEGKTPGLMGSTIIHGKATDVVDVSHYLGVSRKNWFEGTNDDIPFGSRPVNETGDTKRIMLVDDSQFFRNMLAPLLKVAGYEVVSFESPVEALKKCQEGGVNYDAIISDIEMPDMDGFEFARKIREESSLDKVPLVALTSHATQQDIQRGQEVGFDQYLAKFDKDALLETLSNTLSNNGEAA